MAHILEIGPKTDPVDAAKFALQCAAQLCTVYADDIDACISRGYHNTKKEREKQKEIASTYRLLSQEFSDVIVTESEQKENGDEKATA